MGLYLSDLETLLGRHLAILQPAAALPGATAMSVIDALITSLTTIRRGVTSASTGGVSSAPGGGGSMPSAASGGTANNDAVEAVLTSPAHQTLITKLEACDLTTEAGRRDGFTAGFSPDHVYSVRALTYGEANVVRRDAALAKLGELRPYLIEYTNYCLRVDLTTGLIPENLSLWSVVGADGTKKLLFKGFWSAEFVSMDWYGSTTEPGLLSYVAARDLTGFKSIPAADHYCIPALLGLLQSACTR